MNDRKTTAARTDRSARVERATKETTIIVELEPRW